MIQRCEGCGASAPVLKSVRWRHGATARKFHLCGECYSGLAPSLWIVKGRLPVWGQCRECSRWFSVNELDDLVGGGRWDSFVGTCAECR